MQIKLMSPWESWTNQLGGNNTDLFAVNVHIVRDYDTDNASGVYNSVGDFIVVERGVYANPQRLTTLAHEIGHFFTLEHTHRNSDKGKCRQEAVSRTRKFKLKQFFGCIPPKWGKICEKSGDGFCDTPADPELSSSKVNSSCNYTAGETDNWGDTYHPDENNIMSYSRRSCRNNFSYGQASAMYYNMFFGRSSKFQLIDFNETDPDEYEPDDSDFPFVPRLIAIGESQCHSIHNISECQDEVDWLAIDNSNGMIGSYIIEIDNIGNATNPVGEVRVWNTDNNRVRTTEISTTTSTNGTIQSFEIDCSDATSNIILIEVRADDNIEEGKYQISLNSSFQLPSTWSQSQVCVDDEITLNFVPDGAPVSWSSSPNITLSATTGVSTTINKCG